MVKVHFNRTLAYVIERSCLSIGIIWKSPNLPLQNPRILGLLPGKRYPRHKIWRPSPHDSASRRNDPVPRPCYPFSTLRYRVNLLSKCPPLPNWSLSDWSRNRWYRDCINSPVRIRLIWRIWSSFLPSCNPFPWSLSSLMLRIVMLVWRGRGDPRRLRRNHLRRKEMRRRLSRPNEAGFGIDDWVVCTSFQMWTPMSFDILPVTFFTSCAQFSSVYGGFQGHWILENARASLQDGSGCDLPYGIRHVDLSYTFAPRLIQKQFPLLHVPIRPRPR